MAYWLKGKKTKIRFEPLDDGLIEQESENYRSSVTSTPMENGCDFNDHISLPVSSFNISGIIIGGRKAIQDLRYMQYSRDIISYQGVSVIHNLVITSLKIDCSYKNEKGAFFSISFQQLNIVNSSINQHDDNLIMTEQDKGRTDEKQFQKIENIGLKFIAMHPVSALGWNEYRKHIEKAKKYSSIDQLPNGYSGI